jgi:hypothetical protein
MATIDPMPFSRIATARNIPQRNPLPQSNPADDPAKGCGSFRRIGGWSD